MVKAVYGEKLSGSEIGDFYSDLDRHDSTKTHAEYTDTDTGYNIVLDGEKFTYGGGGAFDGTISSIKFTDDSNKPLLTVTGASYDGSELIQAFGLGGSDGLIEFMFQSNDSLLGSKAADDIYGGEGKDTIDGGKGNDLIEGGVGKDNIKGGAGSDEFMFTAGDGKDTIIDFDANGGGLKQDYISIATDVDVDVSYSKKGALVDFGDGDSIMLLGVKKGEFTGADIHNWDFA